MAPTRTKTIKNKHAAKNSGIKGSKEARNPKSDGVVKAKRQKGKPTPSATVKGRTSIADLLKKRQKKVYREEELDIPKLNTITPVGVQKPKGRKKGKVFADDRDSMNTILALVQAENAGHLESKMMKTRQLEEIREARRKEAEKKEEERKAKFEQTKDSLRKKRKRTHGSSESNIKDIAATGTKAAKPKKKRVSFAQD